MPDNINAPAHYTVYPVQPIEICRHLDFCLGNAVKYVLRAPFKNGLEDYRKALKYLEWTKETIETESCKELPNYALLHRKISDLVKYILKDENEKLHSVMTETTIFLRALNGFLEGKEEIFLIAMIIATEKLIQKES